MLIVRLAPVDYHHMHYPDDGTTRDHQRLGRRLWTVNWHALQSKPDILFANEAEVRALRDRGVEFEEYDFPGLETVDGIATVPAGRAAWFRDTEGNILGVVQLDQA